MRQLRYAIGIRERSRPTIIGLVQLVSDLVFGSSILSVTEWSEHCCCHHTKLLYSILLCFVTLTYGLLLCLSYALRISWASAEQPCVKELETPNLSLGVSSNRALCCSHGVLAVVIFLPQPKYRGNSIVHDRLNNFNLCHKRHKTTSDGFWRQNDTQGICSCRAYVQFWSLFVVSDVLWLREFIPATEKCMALTDYLEIEGHMIFHDLTYISATTHSRAMNLFLYTYT